MIIVNPASYKHSNCLILPFPSQCEFELKMPMGLEYGITDSV